MISWVTVRCWRTVHHGIVSWHCVNFIGTTALYDKWWDVRQKWLWHILRYCPGICLKEGTLTLSTSVGSSCLNYVIISAETIYLYFFKWHSLLLLLCGSYATDFQIVRERENTESCTAFRWEESAHVGNVFRRCTFHILTREPIVFTVGSPSPLVPPSAGVVVQNRWYYACTKSSSHMIQY
jgi:hypothetical protein